MAAAKSENEDLCKTHLFAWRKEFKNKTLDEVEKRLLAQIDDELDRLLAEAGEDEVAKDMEDRLDADPTDNELRYQLALRYYQRSRW